MDQASFSDRFQALILNEFPECERFAFLVPDVQYYLTTKRPVERKNVESSLLWLVKYYPKTKNKQLRGKMYILARNILYHFGEDFVVLCLRRETGIDSEGLTVFGDSDAKDIQKRLLDPRFVAEYPGFPREASWVSREDEASFW